MPENPAEDQLLRGAKSPPKCAHSVGGCMYERIIPQILQTCPNGLCRRFVERSCHGRAAPLYTPRASSGCVYDAASVVLLHRRSCDCSDLGLICGCDP